MVGERSFFRVQALVGLRVQPLSSERWEAEERSIRADRTAPQEIPENELTRWLERVEEKLDLLLSHLQIENPAPALRNEPQEVVISGGSISYQSDRALAQGTRLLLEIDLGAAPSWIRCLGRVVRCEPQDSGLQVVVHFEVIREMDRDRIIEFALESERRCIQGRESAVA